MKNLIIFIIVIVILGFVAFEFVPYFVEAYQDPILFKSVDNGKTWQKIFKSPNLNVLSIAIDPENSDHIYLGTQKNGLYKSYSQGKFWHSIDQQRLSDRLRIQQIVIDKNNPNQIYLLAFDKKGKVFKTQDKGKTWQESYVSEEELSLLALDTYQSSILYLADTQGGLFKSSDYGMRWRLLGRFDEQIIDLIVNPKDTRILYLALENGQIYQSFNKGENWRCLADLSEQFKGIKKITKLVLNSIHPNELYLGSEDGLFNSWDSGKTWHKMNLVMGDKSNSISALAIEQENLFYGSGSIVYNTNNQGNDWQVAELAKGREISAIVFDPNNLNRIYLGTKD